METVDAKNIKICLVCSSGGHFFQLHSLKEVWGGVERFWVTFHKEDTSALLRDEKSYWAYAPTNRNITNLIRNFFLAIKVLRKERPTVLLSTGAGIGVPFLIVAKIMGITTIYIESLTRLDDLSLSAKLAYIAIDHLFVQWPELSGRWKKARYVGQVL